MQDWMKVQRKPLISNRTTLNYEWPLYDVIYYQIRINRLTFDSLKFSLRNWAKGLRRMLQIDIWIIRECSSHIIYL